MPTEQWKNEMKKPRRISKKYSKDNCPYCNGKIKLRDFCFEDDNFIIAKCEDGHDVLLTKDHTKNVKGYLRAHIINIVKSMFGEDKIINCYDPKCKGHFHCIIDTEEEYYS